MLAASTFVVLAVSSTGSARPWDWTRADPAAAVSRYQLCGRQGLGAIGCMLSAGFVPASGAPAAGHRAQPLFSVATVQDQAPAGTSGSGGRARPATPGSTSSTRSGSAGEESGHLVKLPANASTDDVFIACQTAMKAAQTQGTAAMAEVEDECEADLASRCPAAMRPLQGEGTTAIQELEDECGTPTPQPSASPRDE